MIWEVFLLSSTVFLGEDRIVIDIPVIGKKKLFSKISNLPKVGKIKLMTCRTGEEFTVFDLGNFIGVFGGDRSWLFGINHLSSYFLIGKITISDEKLIIDGVCSVNIILKIFWIAGLIFSILVLIGILSVEIISGNIFSLNSLIFVVLSMFVLALINGGTYVISKYYQFCQRSNINKLKNQLRNFAR